MADYATQYLAKHIEQKQLSIIDISKRLHISITKLIPETRESLTAEEFLMLCQYLQVKPEEIIKEQEKRGNENMGVD